MEEPSERQSQPPWQKVLYLRQPYEDNYVGESFLDKLVLNAHVQHYDYLALCRGAMGIVQQLCLLCVFVSVWSRVQRRLWSHGALLALDVLGLAAGYACELASGRWRDLTPWVAVRDILRGIRAAVPLWVFAPVLQTLTRSWSDDTIVTMTLVLLSVHVVRYDYGGTSGDTALPGGAMAINAAVLAATILASRLESPEQVFAFIAFAMEVFALLPRLSLRLRQHAPSVHALAATPALALTAACLLGTGPQVVLLAVVLVVVGFVGPALLVWAQRYKAEIQGPWDIAHVEPK